MWLHWLSGNLHYHFNEETKNQKQVQDMTNSLSVSCNATTHISNAHWKPGKRFLTRSGAESTYRVDRVYFFGIEKSPENEIALYATASPKPWLIKMALLGRPVFPIPLCLVIGFIVRRHQFHYRQSPGRQRKGAKRVLVTANPAAIHQGIHRSVTGRTLPSNTYIDRISAIYHSSLWSIWSMLISLIKAENKRKLSLIATGKIKSFLLNASKS